ncbi:MAG: cysteine desulfurase [Candidatus Diapherotrites archaeon]
MFDVEKVRADFPLLKRTINGKLIVYLDSTASSLKPQSVIDAMDYYYENVSANVNRGLHKLSEEASETYENAHESVGKFIGGKGEETAFSKNCTESINLVAYSLLESGYFKAGDKIVVSEAEHHANLVPWQFVAKKTGAQLEFVKVGEDFELDLEDAQRKIDQKTKLVALAHVYNTIASINPVEKIGKMAHEKGALFLVDGAQSVPHMPVNVRKLNCDFLAFSAHKMCGPTGIGALWAKKEWLEKATPFLYGGDMIYSVSLREAKWNKVPEKFEAGTPPIAEAYGWKAACEYLQKIGMQEVQKHDQEITKYALEKLVEIGSVRVFGPNGERGATILFETPKLSAHELALALDEEANVCVRSGMHCAEPIVSKLNAKGLARASFYLYTSKQEIDVFAQSLQKIVSAFH